jgi:hypothetical protein
MVWRPPAFLDFGPLVRFGSKVRISRAVELGVGHEWDQGECRNAATHARNRGERVGINFLSNLIDFCPVKTRSARVRPFRLPPKARTASKANCQIFTGLMTLEGPSSNLCGARTSDMCARRIHQSRPAQDRTRDLSGKFLFMCIQLKREKPADVSYPIMNLRRQVRPERCDLIAGRLSKSSGISDHWRLRQRN